VATTTTQKVGDVLSSYPSTKKRHHVTECIDFAKY